MAFNVADFAATVAEKDVLRNNFFLFRCFMPNGLLGTVNDVPAMRSTRDLEYWCEAVDLPGIGILTHDGMRYGYGSIERRPSGVAQFQPLRCTFISDGAADNFNYFYTWMNMIYNFNMSQGVDGITGTASFEDLGGRAEPFPHKPFFVSYPTQYTVDLNILVFDKMGHQVKNIICRNGFPVAMDSPSMNWADNNSYARLGIHFSFTDWFLLPVDNFEPIPLPPFFNIDIGLNL